jgi:hypothetical protein
MVTLLADIYVRGWMTVSGWTRAAQVRVCPLMNGLTRLMLSWSRFGARLEEPVPFGVLAADVQTGRDKERMSWVDIF